MVSMDIAEKPLHHFASIKKEVLLSELHTSVEKGLREPEVEKRLRKFGYNVLVEEKRSHWIIRYLSNFKNPLVLILLFAAITSYVLGDFVDAVIITCIVVISTLLNFVQEQNAGKAAEKLRERVAHVVTVIRDGEKKEMKATQVCIGDIIQIAAGDLIPADARIITAEDFFVNQSALTGESFPVEKVDTVISGTSDSLSRLDNMVFSGSSVTTGSATAVVIKTGAETEFGKIGSSITSDQTQSEFTIGVRNLSMLIMRTTVFFVLFIFFINTIIKHTDLLSSFTFAVALAVGLTPELLPIIMSINMAKGSLRMAKKGVIVKRLTAIPNFGSMDVLCTDKTGTLTEANIQLVKYVDVVGNDSENVLLHAYLNSYFHTGIRNPLDDAVVRYKHEAMREYKKIDEIPFDFERRKNSIVVKKGEKHLLVTKGAPENIYKSSTHYEKEGKRCEPLTPQAREEITKVYHQLSAEGYHVLGVAVKDLDHQKTTFSKHDETDMILLGFIAFLDPAKKDVKDVLARLKAMGIEEKIITGDNELTTEKICRDVGLDIKGVLLGDKMETLTNDALRVVVEKTTIFARLSPEQKDRVIQALKKNGHVVGYMGDGINDAPSLKAADVGISVNTAVDVAKESADIILTHKSLKELEEGVLEGRKTFANTMKYIMMGISSNFGNMFSVLGAVLIIPFLPMLSVQILLNNLLYDVAQITLPSDNVDREYIQSPRRWNMRFIKEFMVVFGTVSSVFDFLTYYVLFHAYSNVPHLFQTGWFMESLATQTLVIHVIRTRYIPFVQSTASPYLLLSTVFIVILGWLIPFTILGSFFNFVPLPMSLLWAIVLIVLGYLGSAEVVKRFFYRRYSM